MVAVLALVLVFGGVVFVAVTFATTSRGGAARMGVGVAGVVGAGVVVLLVVVGLLNGVPGGLGDDEDDESGPASLSRATVPTPPPEVVTARRIDERDPGAMVTLLMLDPADGPLPVPVAARLRDGDVLRLRILGFDPGSPGRVRQCVDAPDGPRSCRNPFPVQADDAGAATFQYQVGPGGGCGPDDACIVVVSDGARRALLATVFGADPPPPARLAVPAGPHEPGAQVQVKAAGLAPGERTGLTYCAPECGTAVVARAGPDGVARATVTLEPTCRTDSSCVVALVGVGARSTRARVAFVASLRPDHDPRRIAAAFGGAVVLLAVAWVVARRTDWSPPSEAATPLMDAVEL